MQSTSLSTRWKKSAIVLGLATSVGVTTLLLAGCGGTSTKNNSIRETVASTPTAYGISSTFLTNGGVIQEISGFESADESTMYLTGAQASTAVPINTIQGPEGTIALGFAPGAAFENGALGQAVAPGTSVRFRASLSNGTDANGKTYEIASASLTSPDLPGQTIPLTFSPNTGSAFGLANATYTTAPFTLPATLTTGLHTFTLSVTDTKPQTTTTTYQVVVVKPGDAAIEAILYQNDGATPDVGTTVTVTNPTGGTAQGVADDEGVVILFTKAVPNPETLSVTTKNGTVTQTVAVASGALTSNVTDAKGNATPVQIVEATPAPTPSPAPAGG